jgi:hypothetical protein
MIKMGGVMSNFNQVCPGGNIAAQLKPYAPAELEHEEEWACGDCGELLEECRCLDKKANV